MSTLTVGDLRKALADLDLADTVEVEVSIVERHVDRACTRPLIEIHAPRPRVGAVKAQRLRLSAKT